MSDNNDQQPGLWDRFKKIATEQADTKILPEDENVKANNLRNSLVSYLGLPDSWQMSRADEKRYNENLPMMMGMGAMGTVGSKAVAPAIENMAAAKGIHEIEKQATQKALEEASQVAEKGSELFKNTFYQLKNKFMKESGA